MATAHPILWTFLLKIDDKVKVYDESRMIGCVVIHVSLTISNSMNSKMNSM